jgi:hypothetical protein
MCVTRTRVVHKVLCEVSMSKSSTCNVDWWIAVVPGKKHNNGQTMPLQSQMLKLTK